MARLVETDLLHDPFVLGELARIGRGEDNDLVLAEPTVSRRHAEVRRQGDGRYVIVDLQSTHGTWVGDERVKERELRDGDEISLGHAHLRFEMPRVLDLAAGDLRITASVDVTPPLSSSPTALPLVDTLGAPESRGGGNGGGNGASTGQGGDGDSMPSREYRRLRAAFALSSQLGVEHDLRRLVRGVFSTAFQLLPADRAASLLFDPTSGRTSAREARLRNGLSGETALSRSIVRQVFTTREALRCDDARTDPRLAGEPTSVRENMRSALYVPMLYRGEVLGILYVDSVATPSAFSDADFEVARVLADQTALAVANARLVEHVHTVKSTEQQHLAEVMSGLPVGVLLLARDGRILLANPRADEILAGVVMPLSGGHTIPPRPSETPFAVTYIEALLKQVHEGSPIDVSVPGNTPRIVEMSVATCRYGSDGETIVVMRDVTAERERERRESRQERLALVGQITSGVAHDFNNALSVIVNYSDILLRHLKEPEARAEAELVAQAGRRAAGLTRQLLAFSQRTLTVPELVNLSTMVADLERLLRRTLGAHVTLSTELASGLPNVEADPAKLEQVILNLVLNARDAMPQGGGLLVRTEHHFSSRNASGPADTTGVQHLPHNEVRLTVSDTGAGMSPEVAARVFEPFFTTKAQGEGTGLGLVTVQRVVQQAGGRIDFESTPGVGTTFRVTLPVASAMAQSATVADDSQPSGGSERLLVVEDDDAVRGILRRLLTDAGYAVLDAASGEEALRLVKERGMAIDLLVADVLMPRMTGPRLAQILREDTPSLRALYISGYAGAMEPEQVPAGETVVVKPFTRNALLRGVRRVLDRTNT